MPYPRFTPEELRDSAGKTVPDVIAPDLKVLLVGINPGLYSAAVGYHFARPGNRFWPALYRGGITPRLLKPGEQNELLAWGYGITNIVTRASASADELSRAELVEGGKALVKKIEQNRPRIVAILGLGAYRTAFARPKAIMGVQAERLGGSFLWVLPNPSGLNAHYSLSQLGEIFRELKQAAG